METLSTLCVPEPHVLHDLSESRNLSSAVCNSQCVFTSSPPVAGMWTQQLSPHLQRNKQLQDALLQREEELARLQEENHKLREFLNSSFVRSLQQKAQKLSADRSRNPKRTLTGPSQVSKQISKRVCRNLTAQFCADSCSEPNLDLWVLRTLGLKDRDTIDTSSESSPEDTFRALGSGAASRPSSSPEWTPGSCCSSTVDSLTPSSVHSFCQRPEPESGPSHSFDGLDRPTQLPQNCTGTPGDFTRQTGPYGPTLILSPNGSGSFLSDPSGTSPVQTQDRNLEQSSFWSLLPQNWTLSRFFSPKSSSGPVPNIPWPSSGVCSPPSQPTGSQSPDPPQRPDLAFSMSLSPSSSVKTHSFPQGQAFVRRDTGGRWNFTWVPRQEPESMKNQDLQTSC